MESVGLFLNADNVRTLVLLVAIICGVVWQKSSLLELKIDLLKEMDNKFEKFYQAIKSNDFAHLNSTIEALTFTLEKNGFLKREDKEYIDGRLDK